MKKNMFKNNCSTKNEWKITNNVSKLPQKVFSKMLRDAEIHLLGQPFSVLDEEAPENIQMDLIDLQTSDLCKSNKYRDLGTFLTFIKL